MSLREEQKIQRIRQILYIALEEFLSKGFYGTSTREISRIAGISSGLMFHYFESKEVLYEKLIEIGCGELIFDEKSAYENPLYFFREKANGILHNLKNNTFYAKMFVFMNNAHYTTKISETSNQLLQQHDIITQSIPVFVKGQELKQIREGDPKALSIAFWCALQGIAEEVAYAEADPLPELEWLLDLIQRKE